MVLNVLKFVVFASVILLIGQIRVGNRTLGEKFHDEVKSAAVKGGNQLVESKFFASLADTSYLKRWIRNVYPPRPTKTPEDPKAELKADDSENFSASDRESLLRLLQ